MIPLISSMSDFSELMVPLRSIVISQLPDRSGYELHLLGLGDIEGVDRLLARVGTCRGEVRIFKTIDSIRAWLVRNGVSPYVPIYCHFNLTIDFDSPLSQALRCKGCGRFERAAYVGAPVCHSCSASLSLECDARTE